jgi:hypothetical protein
LREESAAFIDGGFSRLGFQGGSRFGSLIGFNLCRNGVRDDKLTKLKKRPQRALTLLGGALSGTVVNERPT